MASKLKSFSNSKKKDVSALEPIVFDYYGEEVTALSFVPGRITLQYLEGISSDDSSEQLKAVRFYLEKSFDKANLTKFNKTADNPENAVELEDLVEVMGYLAEERANRSFKESSASE